MNRAALIHDITIPRQHEGPMKKKWRFLYVLVEREASPIFPWMKDPDCSTSLGESSSPFVTISVLDALGRREMRIGFHHKTEANLWKFTPYNIDGFDIISIKRVEECIHDVSLQQYFATCKWLISLQLENACKNDRFCNKIPPLPWPTDSSSVKLGWRSPRLSMA